MLQFSDSLQVQIYWNYPAIKMNGKMCLHKCGTCLSDCIFISGLIPNCCASFFSRYAFGLGCQFLPWSIGEFLEYNLCK